jgi:hypothetical protein
MHILVPCHLRICNYLAILVHSQLLVTNLRISRNAGRGKAGLMNNSQVKAAQIAATRGGRVVAVAAVFAGVTGLTVGRAEAGLAGEARQAAQITRQFTCSFPVIGGQQLTGSFTRPGVYTVTTGVPTPRLTITVTASVSAAARTLASIIGAASVEATADVTGDVDAPQGDIGASITFTLPRTAIPGGSGPVTATATGTLPSLVLDKAGAATIVIKSMELHVTPLTASGGETWVGQINSTCTLDSSQSDVLLSGQVVSPAPSSTPTSIATRPNPAPTPSPTRAGPTPTRPDPTSAAWTASPGPKPSVGDTGWLPPLVGGGVIAAAGGGGGWWLRRRRGSAVR